MKFLLPILCMLTLVSCESATKQPAKNGEEEKEVQANPEVGNLRKLIARHFAVNDSLQFTNPDKMEDSTFQLLLHDHRIELFNSVDSIDRLMIVRSEDLKFCIVSWNTGLGGTMIDFASMAIYAKGNGELVSVMLVQKNKFGETFNQLMLFTNLYSLSATSGETYYVALGHGQGSTAMPWEIVQAFQVKGDQLLYPKIFPKDSKVFVVFDAFQFNDHTDIPKIAVHEKGQRIRIPVSDDQEGFSGEWLTLTFDGNKFGEEQ